MRLTNLFFMMLLMTVFLTSCTITADTDKSTEPVIATDIDANIESSPENFMLEKSASGQSTIKESAPKPNHDNAHSFLDDLAVVRMGEYPDVKYGYINSTGELSIPYIYDSALDFNEGLALVEKDGKYGFINRDGKETIPLIFDAAEDFFNDLAQVRKDDKWGAIDRTGEIIIPIVYDYVS